MRGPGGIDNQLHDVDVRAVTLGEVTLGEVTLGEEACQVRSTAAPQVLAAWRRAAVALVRLTGWTTSAAGRRAGAWRPGAVLRLLGLPSA